MLTNDKIEADEGVELSKSADIKAQALDFSVRLTSEGLEVQNRPIEAPI